MPRAGPPIPTLLYRLVHLDNLPTLLKRGALHSPNSTPNDGLHTAQSTTRMCKRAAARNRFLVVLAGPAMITCPSTLALCR